MKKIIYINLDGFSYSYYEELSRRKRLNIDDLKQDGIMFSNLKSGLISITNPMQSAILCGAWCDKTGNYYQHFDLETRQVIKHKRTFHAQNIAQLLTQKGKTVVSIHQFMLENNPCVAGVKDRAYIVSERPTSNYIDRFSLLFQLLKGEEVQSGGERFSYEAQPDFIALYIDDLDALGHNNDYEQYPKRQTYTERLEDIYERLLLIDQKIGETVQLLKEKSLYDETILLITTDHGMTPFYGASKASELVNVFYNSGVSCALAPDFRVQRAVLLPYTIACSVYFSCKLSREERDNLIQNIKRQAYVDEVFLKKEMMKRFGYPSDGCDMIIFAKRGYHFYHRDFNDGYFGASHDSRDSTSQHIFGLLVGGCVKKLGEVKREVFGIDLLPSILGHENLKMKDSYGRVFKEWFI